MEATPSPPPAPQPAAPQRPTLQPAPLSYRRAEVVADAPDNCYRCGYPLLGIDDEQACPECGLLARRSRRTTDELHNTRPRWLARISRGADLILMAILIAAAWPFAVVILMDQFYLSVARSGLGSMLPLLGFDMAAVLLCIGAYLLSSPEHYPPADRADRKLRIALCFAAAVPLAALLLLHFGGSLIGAPWRPRNWGRVLRQVLGVVIRCC